MPDILLINPNASTETTAMMVNIAASGLPVGCRVLGATASAGPSMIVNETELNAAAFEVEKVWQRERGTGWAGVVISAYGDPGIDLVRASCSVPVVGICEASMLEAGADGRRFGIATVTPDLTDALLGRAVAYGMAPLYTGIQLTEGDPRALAADPVALEEALARAVQRCIDHDGAQAVVIGGGPLGQAAVGLASRFSVPVIAPISAAMRRLCALIHASSPYEPALAPLS